VIWKAGMKAILGNIFALVSGATPATEIKEYAILIY